MAVDAPMSDYERIGGGRAVSAVVDRFYELVLDDSQLAPFFVGLNMNRLKRHQVLLISQVMGGPSGYDGRTLRDAHGKMNISHDHFGRTVGHLVSALHEASVPGDIIGRIGYQLGGTEKDIVQVMAD